MADKYIKSGTSGTATPFESWLTAATTIASAASVDAAGEIYYISSAHSESSATSQTIALAGTLSAPNKIICVSDDSVTPPVTSVTSPTAVVATTGASNITITNSGYISGIIFNIGSGSGTGASINMGSSTDLSSQIYDICDINLNCANTQSRINIGVNSAGIESAAIVKNSTIKYSNASQVIIVNHNYLELDNVTINSSGTRPNLLVSGLVDGVLVRINNCDLSWLATTGNLITGTAASGGVTISNCKLPSAWTGSLIGAISNARFRASMYNCWYSDINYSLWIETSAGSIRDNTANYKDTGSSDGTTSLSWKMTTNSTANEAVNPLISDTIAIWLDNVGTTKTIVIDILHDSIVSLTNADVWLEISCLESSTTPLGSSLHNKRGSILTTAVNQPTSISTWTTSGITNPNKQKLEVSFTPQMKGFVYARVCLAKPSYTIYVDYEPTVT